MQVSEKLIAARKVQPGKLSQYDVAELLGVKRPTYHAWESGQNQPPTKVIKQIADAWRIPLEWFFDGQDTPVPKGESAPPPETKTVASDLDRPRFLVSYQPLQMRFAGIVPAAADWGDPLDSEEMIEVDARYEHPKRFAAQLVGSSCYPALEQGDLTIWHADEAPAAGLIVLAQNTEHQCTVKQLKLDPDGNLILVPINPDASAPPAGDGWKPIARLVVVIRASGRIERTWYHTAGLRPEDFE